MKTAVVVLSAVVLIGASSIASTSAIAIQSRQAFKVEDSTRPLAKRHGDHEHQVEEEEVEEHHEMAMNSSDMVQNAVEASSKSVEITPGSVVHSHDHHGDKIHHHLPNPYDSIPDPLSQDENTFIPIPHLPKGSGGHSHGGHGEPKMDLNETIILRQKGPDPLSYIEWDFAYGLGHSDTLLRFATASQKDESNSVMGVSGNRYRTLVDEKDGLKRVEIASDIKSRVSSQDPARHRSLLILHVAGCIISCFALLPLGKCISMQS